MVSGNRAERTMAEDSDSTMEIGVTVDLPLVTGPPVALLAFGFAMLQLRQSPVGASA